MMIRTRMTRTRGRRANRNIYIAIDNGVSGTIGIIDKFLDLSHFILTPTKQEQSATKKKQIIGRIRHEDLYNILSPYVDFNVKVRLERPYTGKYNKANSSAARVLESTLIVLERLDYSFEYIDSKEWQRALLPKGVKGSPELKKASEDIGCRMFPQHRELIESHGDADGILIAEYLRRINL